ncbi:site-specific integrase [Ruegeria sp. Alg231-54]|uniref:site-specific integrase n=1 Tax=Ruegeria sp. Alg231-54 TaxID=1922221 RepID=UPI000D561EE2|nr:site-specific integrase [Ruegeria sp. Alg231-54]
MMLSSYLSLSRHGVYYFRWPIPPSTEQKRATVRISLRTRCPRRAGDLARFLSSCGRLIPDQENVARLRQDQIRSMVQRYFKASLDKYLERLNDKGFPEKAVSAMQQEIEIHENAAEGEDLLSDLYLDSDAFCKASDIDSQDWEDNALDLRREMRKGRRDMLRRVLEAVERLEHYSYDDAPAVAISQPAKVLPASSPIGTAIDDFIAEHSRQWAEKTVGQNRAYLNILVEYFGPERLLSTIAKQDANEVKKVLQALPSSRNTKPALKNMPLMEVIKLPGQKKIAPKTINSHIQMFKGFFDWAERHGYSPHSLFDGMKVAKEKNSTNQRKPFSPEQIRFLYTELTTNPSGLVRKDSHKWGMLLGIFTGARLNEICQLGIKDVQQECGTWFLNITDEGDDDNKSVKSTAARRKVPVHPDLIRLGFLDFVDSRRNGTRLFPDYNYNANGGYGRALGRWCNESFLPKLGLKEPGLVFHSLRHTVVTRLGQANVAEPIIQCIVGHARSGVTQEVYLREGYTLDQLGEAIRRLKV